MSRRIDTKPENVAERKTLEGDRALLSGYRDGDRKAFTEVFHMYVNDVMQMLRAGVVVDIEGYRTRIAAARSEFDLENLVQETFAKAFSPAARLGYDGVRPFSGYLITIARNIAIDRARKQRRERRHIVVVEEIEKIPTTPGGTTDPTLRLEEGQLITAVARFRDALSPSDREIFRVRYEDGKPLRDAAKLLNIGMFELRRRDATIRIDLLRDLRAAGFLETAKVRIGKSLLGGRSTNARSSNKEAT